MLAAIGAAGTAGLAGCSGSAARDCGGEQRSVEVPPAGGSESDVTVAAYEDFECPGCAQYAQQVYPAVVEEYVENGEIAYERHDFPVTIDGEWSWKVPNAAFAAGEDAGEDAYYGFVEEAYRLQDEYSEDAVAGLAADLGADEDHVRAAIDEEPFCEQLNESVSEAQDRGVEATPTVFVDDQRLEAPAADELRRAIESALS